MQIYDLGFHVGVRFFGSCLSSAQKAWRQTIAALGVSRLLDRIEAFVPPLSPPVCHWCIVIPVIAFLYIYILLLLLSLLSLLISNFYLLNGYIYICINCNILSLIYIVIDSIPERSSVLTVGQPFRCSDSVTIEAAME
jgi:hypothetical protein